MASLEEGSSPNRDRVSPRSVHHLRLGSRCTNACRHCKYREDVAETRAYLRAFAPLARALPAAFERGDGVVLHGPEPAAQPGFAALLRGLKAVRADVTLYTTGRPFADHRRAAALRRRGVRRFVVPVFGPDAASHDAVAGGRGAFTAAVEGVGNLLAFPGAELRLDVLVVPAKVARVPETVAVWRQLCPGARVRLVHLLPLGGAARHPECFDLIGAETVAAALRPLLDADTGVSLTHFDERRYPWAAGRREDARARDERFARLEQLDAACAGPNCAHCAYDGVCSYFRRRHDHQFESYNLTVEAPCSLACGFCQRRFTDSPHREEPLDSILERLQRDTEGQSIGRVRINGADPLAHPRIPDILAAIAAKGVPDLHLFTPGLRLAEPGFAKELFGALAPFRATLFSPIYGPDAATHDAIVGREGAFAMLRQAMRALQPFRKLVCFTTLVLKQNYRQLAEIYDLVRGEGFAMEAARFVRPFSDDPRDYAAVAPRMRDVIEYYRRLGREDLPCFLGLFSFVPCTYWDVFPTEEGLAAVEIDAGSYDVTAILRSHDQFRLKRDQVAHCDRPDCAVYERCLNQAQYYQVHGFDELRPLAPDGSFRDESAGESSE